MTDTSGIEELLLLDQHVVALHRFEHEAFPKIDYSMWRSPIKAEGEIIDLQTYINSVGIEDDFGSDHSARREWRNSQFDAQIQNMMEKDSLRRRGFLHALDHVSEITEGYHGTNKVGLIEKRDKLLEGMPDNYKVVPTEQKISFVNTVKQRAYNVLQFLSEQSPAS